MPAEIDAKQDVSPSPDLMTMHEPAASALKVVLFTHRYLDLVWVPLHRYSFDSESRSPFESLAGMNHGQEECTADQMAGAIRRQLLASRAPPPPLIHETKSCENREGGFLWHTTLQP
jgi:hypothetical protein